MTCSPLRTLSKALAGLLPAAVTLVATSLTQNAQAQVHWRVTDNFRDRTVLQSTLDALDANERDINAFAVHPTGEWILVSDSNVYASSGFNSTVRTAAARYVNAGHRAKGADCSPAGGCIIIYENWGYHRVGPVPDALLAKLNEYRTNNWGVRDVEMTNSGYVLLGPGSVASYSGIDADLAAAIYDRRRSNRQINDVTIGFDGSWALVAAHNPMYENITQRLAGRLDTIARSSLRVDNVIIGVGDNYLVYSGATDGAPDGQIINAIEYRLGVSSNTNIWTRMNALNVPGLAIALIEPGRSNPRVALTRGYGKKRADRQQPVLGRTAFDLASLSKYLGALAIMDYTEGNGTNINSNIFSHPDLNSGDTAFWRQIGQDPLIGPLYGIPANALGTGITLRRLMSHTAGLNTRGSTLIPQSEWTEADDYPTSSWLLGMACSVGQQCDATGNAWAWRTLTSGAQLSYSSPSYLVLQSYLEDRTGQSIHGYLRTRIFDRIGMPNSTSLINLSSSFLYNAAWQHSAGVPRSWLAQSAWPLAGGIWSSAEDYANAMIVLLNQGRNSRGTTVIDAASVTTMLQNVPLISGNSGWGLGVDLDATVTEINDEDFFHNGIHSGRAYTYMCGNPTRDQGIVILTNSRGGGEVTLVNEILSAYTSAAGWPASRTCN